MKRVFFVFLFGMFINNLVFAGGIVPPKQDPDNPQWVRGEILIKFKDDVELQISSNRGIMETGNQSLDVLNDRWQVSEMEKVFKTEEKRTETKTITTYTGETRVVPQLFNIYKMKIPDATDVDKAVYDFERNPHVEYAEPNYIARMCIIPDDPSFSNQWGLNNTGQYHLADADIDAPEAWEIETGDSTVVIAIIDTGVDYGHPDLTDKMVSTGYDFVNNDDDAMDDNGHGSHVAGIAAATTNNALGIAGVTWNCKILPAKVLQSNGYGTYSDIASGVNYAANNGAKVINLSLGGYNASYTLQTALENAYTTAFIVASAGNDGTGTPMYPAAYNFVFGVGASGVFQQTGQWYEGTAGFSNGGVNTELYAPGVNIYSTIPLFHPHTYSYASWNGTSMAAPFVTGTVALIRSHFTDWSNELIRGQLINTTDGIAGGIRLNTHKALTQIANPQLSLYSHTIIDTIAGCDQDGIADAGETVEIVFDIHNTWEQAYNVQALLLAHSFEDTCFVTIIDSISDFGSVSSYAHVNNESNPFRFFVKTTTPNNTDVYFDYEIICDGGHSFTGSFYITTQRGFEIGGIITEDVTWSNDYRYIVTAHTLVMNGATLTIEPGTCLRFNSGIYLVIDGCLIAEGTADSIIVFTSNSSDPAIGDWDGIMFRDTSVDAVFDSSGYYVSGSIIKYAEIEFAGYGVSIGRPIFAEYSSPYIAYNFIHDNEVLGGSITLDGSSSIAEYNVISNNTGYAGGFALCSFSGRVSNNIIESNYGSTGGIFLTTSSGIITKNIIKGNSGTSGATGAGAIFTLSTGGIITYNTIMNNEDRRPSPKGVVRMSGFTGIFEYNNIINNSGGGLDRPFVNICYNNIINNRNDINQYEVRMGSSYTINAQHCYWGTINTNLIDEYIWDLYDDPLNCGLLDYNPFETIPVGDTPGFLYDVELDPPSPIGCEEVTFTLSFSNEMDITVQPNVSFGVCDPWTQNIIAGDWSDSTHWQGTYEFNIMTGDGINNLRVASARDCEGMEIPKDTNFSFVVDATGAASGGFIAQAGIEKVDLGWHSPDLVDLMGYNMYRYHEITRSDFSDPIIINTSMITDTTYCDTSVIPYTTYYYMYTCISTDLIESGYSDPASATPFAFFSDFEANPTMGFAPLEVQFTDLSFGNITSWQWDFQNDCVYDSFSQNPTFIYTDAGIYSVKLKVSDGTNVDSLIQYNYLTVECVTPAPPMNVQINISGIDAVISWNAVTGANSYKVYASDNPNTGFVSLTTVTDTIWSTSITEVKKFYYIISSTETIRYNDAGAKETNYPIREPRSYDSNRFLNRKRK